MENNTLETKICSGILCEGESIPLDEFSLNGTKLRAHCRKCRNEYGRIYNIKNKTRISESSKKKRANRSDEVKLIHRQKKNIRNKQYRTENRDKVLETGRKYRQNNKEKTQNYSRSILQIEDRYIKHLLLTLKHSDKKMNRTFDIDFEYFKQLQKNQNNKCKYSGVELIWKSKNGIYQGSIDRIDSSKGHMKGNCQLVTVPINNFKNDLSNEEFIKLINNIRDQHTNAHKNNIVTNLNKIEKEKIWGLFSSMKRKTNIILNTRCVNNQLESYLNIIDTLDTDKHILDFNLNYLQNFCNTNRVCALTGIEITWEPNKLNTGSIDRIDSSKGYSIHNIQVTSLYINYMKNTMSSDKAKEVIQTIINHNNVNQTEKIELLKT